MHDLSGTQPPWPGEAVRRWQACAAAAAQAADLWRVPCPQGDDMLRARIGERFGLDPAMITITAGVRASALSYGRLAPRILLERPTFPGVLSVLTGLGAAVELTDWEWMLHGSLPADCALWFTSPFRNPDGASLSARPAQVSLQATLIVLEVLLAPITRVAGFFVRSFCAVHGQIGVVEKLLGVDTRPVDDGDANAGGDVHLDARQHEG